MDLPDLARRSMGLNVSDMSRQGPVTGVFLGYSQPHRDNGVSSSGGIVRLLIQTALTASTPVICLIKKEHGHGPAILRSVAELAKVPGSIYHGIGFLDAIPLLRSVDQPCYLVSTPCQLEGILKYAVDHEPALLDKIALKIGLICGWMYSDHSLHAFMTYKGIKGDFTDANYRGEDKVGLLKIRTGEGEHKFHRRVFAGRAERLDYAASFSSGANRLRCRLCQDHLNVLCDVAVGDAWLARKHEQKLSIIVTRTPAGLKILRSLEAAGSLHLESSGENDIIESQSEDLVEGQTARRFSRHLRSIGMATPEFVYAETTRQEPPPTLAEQAGFGIERLLRWLLRNKNYRLFRSVYLLRHLSRYHPWVGRLFRIPGKLFRLLKDRKTTALSA
ncbi:MAG: Coenzyme F420 hydrogenase/dehydrogenase, beta subunit C-terminal domain [Prosthecobacter sp.]